MSQLIADIFVTCKYRDVHGNSRAALSARSLNSLSATSDRSQYRLTICVDGTEDYHGDSAGEFIDAALGNLQADYLLQSKENEGLGPTINRAVSHICSVNDWYDHPTHGDKSKVAPFICMCQDDLLYTKDWLPLLANRFLAMERLHNLGFATGLECVEHPIKKDLGGGLILKDWIRAAQMFGRRSYWQSMMPIPPFDPETGRKRAKPNDGIGSGVDWWFIRNHENSVCRTGRTCLVMPGLVQHAGYRQSTWLSREMPESSTDKEKIG